MVINFVGNYQSGYVGEVADEIHLAREIEFLGHIVRRIPRDAWREYVIESYPKGKYDVPEDLKADINIVAKWHQFYDGSFIEALRAQSGGAPVFLWVWDYMQDGTMPAWHLSQVQSADLYLGNDVRNPAYLGMKNCYYFPFDVADGQIESYININNDYKYNVAFFGSCINQGNRKEWLYHINNALPIKIFAWNYEEWIKLGFDAEPAVYGEEFNKKVSETKICLGFSVEPHCWGYWSNRVGKTLLAGGFLLQEYAPGMELAFSNAIEYFSDPKEAVDKIKYYFVNEKEREAIRARGYTLGQSRYSSKTRVKQLMILAERYIKDTQKELWQI